MFVTSREGATGSDEEEMLVVESAGGCDLPVVVEPMMEGRPSFKAEASRGSVVLGGGTGVDWRAEVLDKVNMETNKQTKKITRTLDLQQVHKQHNAIRV